MTCNGSECFFSNYQKGYPDLELFSVFLTVTEQKSNVRLIPEISEFSYLALGQIRKLGNLGKIFHSFRNDLNFISNYDSQFL